MFLAVKQANTMRLYQKVSETHGKDTTFFWFDQIFLTKSYKKVHFSNNFTNKQHTPYSIYARAKKHKDLA